MTEAASDGQAYEALISRIVAQHPQELRRSKGRILGRSRHLASKAFGARAARAAISLDGEAGQPTPGRLMAGAGRLSAAQPAELGLDLPKPPQHLLRDRKVARLGYDFAAANAVLDLVRPGKADGPDDGRYLYLDSGCGHAIRALLLAWPGSRWVGVEANEAASAWAAAHIEGATFAAKPAEPSLAGLDPGFDGVVAFDLTRSADLDEMRSWLAELWRLTKAGGFIVAAAPGFATLAEIANARAAPVDALEAANRALGTDGTATLSIAGVETRLFSGKRFADAVLNDHWHLRRHVTGGGPGLSDTYVAARRPVPLSRMTETEMRTAQAVDGAHVAHGAIVPRTGFLKSREARLLAGMRQPRAEPPRRFVILAMQRTGSNMVVSALNSHPGIFCHGELFRRSADPTARLRALDAIDARFESEADRHEHPEDYLEAIYGAGYDAELVGFKLLSDQHRLMRDRLIADPRYAKILLRRDNVLARYSSAKIATGARSGKAGTVAFVEREFRAFHRANDAFYGDARHRLAETGRPFLEISYVDACTPEGLRAMLSAVGAEPSVELRIRTRKRSSSDIVSRFANPAEVEAYLSVNQLEHWRDEQIA